MKVKHCVSGTSRVDDAHVFIGSGENVRLPCNNALSDCTTTTWTYSRHSTAVSLIELGIKKKDTERHERLSLGSDCSLNIKNITEEDSGSYTCRQYVNDKQQGTDARVYLHVLHAVTVIVIVVASFAVLLPALILWMIRRKRDDNRRGTDDSEEQTDDHVTYSEVTAYSKNQDKKNKVRCDDKVTYASIRGAKAGSQENCSELYASVN
ncbi:uncharacterized protein LOC127510247 [Ctenopharyngodon idella]|uniref:uncharacterized protein LOC127510247 n=1 Tax=Ctenopharyngodon idella TaxID=7959 RepID=UPI002232B61F|nr:uncharacterized protein LOC127510247 [Ctenopharyngodon idella]